MVLKFIDEQIRVLWAGLIENSYLNVPTTAMSMVNVNPVKFGSKIGALSVDKII